MQVSWTVGIHRVPHEIILRHKKGIAKILVDGRMLVRARTANQKIFKVEIEGSSIELVIVKEPKASLWERVKKALSFSSGDAQYDQMADKYKRNDSRYTYMLMVDGMVCALEHKPARFRPNH